MSAHSSSHPDVAPQAQSVSQRTEIPPPEVVVVTSHRIACDGDGGALGHPRIFLELGDKPFVECPYCDRRFVAHA